MVTLSVGLLVELMANVFVVGGEMSEGVYGCQGDVVRSMRHSSVAAAGARRN